MCDVNLQTWRIASIPSSLYFCSPYEGLSSSVTSCIQHLPPTMWHFITDPREQRKNQTWRNVRNPSSLEFGGNHMVPTQFAFKCICASMPQAQIPVWLPHIDSSFSRPVWFIQTGWVRVLSCIPLMLDYCMMLLNHKWTIQENTPVPPEMPPCHIKKACTPGNIQFFLP